MKEQTMNDTFEEGDGSLTMDLTNVQEAVFEVIPRGNYPCVIETCEFGHSQNSGAPMWTLKLSISDGEYAERKLFTHISFSEKAMPYTKRTLNAIAPEFLSGPFDLADGASQMEGKSVTAKVAIEKYEGESRSRVKDLSAATGADSFV